MSEIQQEGLQEKHSKRTLAIEVMGYFPWDTESRGSFNGNVTAQAQRSKKKQIELCRMKKPVYCKRNDDQDKKTPYTGRKYLLITYLTKG